MPDDPRVQQLLAQLFSSGASPEEVCGSCIELLPTIRERWQQVLHMRAELGAMFPPKAKAGSGLVTFPPEGAPLPDIPGYEFECVLGAGGMGVVFKARHLRLNRVVALKMALASAYAGAHERERFQREAESVAALRHPNVVQIHDINESHGEPYFTMEYVEGGNLAEKLAGTPLPAREAAALLAVLAAAVQAAHANGIVHRDLKPGNVLLTADGTPKISDFGLARRLSGEAGLTRTGIALGTPSYMAPEQARGKVGAVGPSADIYSLGTILYEMLTGRPPFRAESAAETVHQLLTQDPVPPSRLNGKVPRDLETICLKCLSKEPRLRYATADALNDDLHRFLRGDAISARPEGRMRRAMRAVRNRPTLAVGGAAGLLIAALLLAAGLWVFFDREFTNRAVTTDLDEMEAFLQKNSLAEAKVANDRALTRLGARTSPVLRERLNQGERDWKLAKRLEKIRLDSAIVIDNEFQFDQVDKDYEEAFRDFGIGQCGDDPKIVAPRIRSSNICLALLAALDHWSCQTVMPKRADWAMKVAMLAEPKTTPWREDARNPDIRRKRESLLGLIKSASVKEESVQLLLALSEYLPAFEKDKPNLAEYKELKKLQVKGDESQISFLMKIQQAHPNDLWANYSLGRALYANRKPEEAIRYYQAVIALRTDFQIGHFCLGGTLATMGYLGDLNRYHEAVVHLRRAIEIEPNSAKSHVLLVGVLSAAGRHEEVIEQAPIALQFNLEAALIHTNLGRSLREKGRIEESLEQFRLACALKPNDLNKQNEYRAALMREHRSGDALTHWRKVLEGDPADHDHWYGYAEMCLYLGQENEYRRARKALLDRFGTSDSPQVAERTARACLLLTLSGEEMSKVLSLADLAAKADRKKNESVYSYFQFVKGFAEYRQGHFDLAIAIMRGDASRMPGPLPKLVLVMAQHRTGKEAEARKTLASAMLDHHWNEDHVVGPDGWIRHVLRREAERMIFPNLAAVLDGKQQPRDNDERLAQIGVCRFENRFAALARIYAEAFAIDPKLTNHHRLAAARVAVQAGCGRGIDASSLGEAERRKWRAQATKWLREELSARREALGRDFNKARDTVRQSLTEWRNEPELASIREPAELEKLSADERADCRNFWAEVNAVLDSTSKTK